jgi:Rrf2 family protein
MKCLGGVEVKLSTKGRYGVKAMMDLAVHYGDMPISIKSISERQGISEYYLEQLFAPLRRAKLVKSVRGAQGGYILNKLPKDITILEIMDVLEGPVEISDCLTKDECDFLDACATRVLWKKIRDSINSVMAGITLQDMLNDFRAMQATPIIEGILINE